VTAVAVVGGSIYICGTTDSPSFPGASTANAGGRDAFCAKLDASGQIVWAVLFGGSGDDIALGVAASSDVVAVVGTTQSSNFPTTSGTVQPVWGGGQSDGFVVTLDAASGARRAATYIGGESADALTCVALGNGRIAVAGTTASTTLSANAHQQQLAGLEDGYVAVLSVQLTSRLWSTYYGGRGFDAIAGIAVASDGSIVIGGTTNSPNTGQAIAAGLGEGSQRATPPDGFVARLSADGQRLWGRYYGSDGQDSVLGLRITSSDQIMLVGMTNGTNTAFSYIATADAVQNQFAGGRSDGFVAVLNLDGTRRWGSYYGGSGDDRCTAAAMDQQGYVLVTGWTTSDDLRLAHSDRTTRAGDADIMVGMFSPDGRRLVASLLYGGSAADLPAGIGWLPDSSIVVAGSTASPSIDPLSGSLAGSMDGFLLQLESLGILSVPAGQSPSTAVFSTGAGMLELAVPPECTSPLLRLCTLDGRCSTVVPTGNAIPLPAGVWSAELECGAQYRVRQLVIVLP
jgi:hypothetical protein